MVNVRALEVFSAHREETAAAVLRAVTTGVPAFAGGFDRPGETRYMELIQSSVDMFVDAYQDEANLSAARSRAFELGRLQARFERGTDELLSAFRVGVRAAWDEYSSVAREEGLDAEQIATLAGELFTFVDEVSAASVAGHAEGMSDARRALDVAREQFAVALLGGTPEVELRRAAARAELVLPGSVTAVVVASHDTERLVSLAPDGSLSAPNDDDPDTTIVVVPDLTPRRRPRLLTALSGLVASVGPTVGTGEGDVSLRLARATFALGGAGVRDVHDHLVGVVVNADPDAGRLLVDRALAALDALPPEKAAALRATLRSWLLHLGRRADVARDLHVHPQTVSYRMSSLQEIADLDLTDPTTVESLVVALAIG